MLPPSLAQRGPTLLITEFGLTALTLGVAFAWPELGRGLFAWAERPLARLAQRKG
jgi:hypothetical protein